MATTVGPVRDKADNSADRSLIAPNVWLPVRRFHVGTNPQRFTLDAGYTTATDSRVDNPGVSLVPREESIYERLEGSTRASMPHPPNESSDSRRPEYEAQAYQQLDNVVHQAAA